MKIALTVIKRTSGIEIEKRFESEVKEMFFADPQDADYHDPVLEGFRTLTKAYLEGVIANHTTTQPTEAAQPHYVDKAVKIDLNTKL